MTELAKQDRRATYRVPLVEMDHNIVHASKQPGSTTKAASQDATDWKTRQIGEDVRRDAQADIDLNATHLISSPYPDFANQLRLEDLETPFRLFAFALSILQPIREDYATAPYLEAFNWSEVFDLLQSLCKRTGFQWKEIEVYVVIFRSKLLASADRERLGLLDQKSHEEACVGGGLIKYWFGETDGERRNLATCLWRHREDATRGGGGPWHKQARESARTMYETITFHTHKLIVTDDVKSWRISEYN